MHTPLVDLKLAGPKLHFLQLIQSFKSSLLIDEQGHWNGTQQDEALRLELQDIAVKLQVMLASPLDTIQNIAQPHHVQAALRYAVCNDIAQNVPLSGSITYHDLAAKACVDLSQSRRLLRLLVSHQVFSEVSLNSIAHTPASRMLLSPDVRSWVEYQTTDSLMSSTQLVEALRKWPSSSSPVETAFNMGHNTSLPMFEHFNLSPGKLDRFRKAMAGMAHNAALSVHHVTSGYTWRDLPTGAVVIDIGGGSGHVASEVAQNFPSLNITLQDIGVTKPGRERGINLESYDFFKPQPVKSADVYFMRQVFHDWSDEYAVRILRNQVNAMDPKSKLVIMDMVMPQTGERPLLEERRSRTTDITMLTLFNAKERDMSEWIALVAEADARLSLTRFTRPHGSILSIMEFSLLDE